MSNQCEFGIASVNHRCFGTLRKHMKSFLLVVATLSVCESAHSQVYSGTVFFVDFSQNEITIAADSRRTYETGEHDNTECKISAFGKKFVFVMAGAAFKVGVWNAHDIARESWKAEAKTSQSAQETVNAVSQHWTSEIEERYMDPDVIAKAERRNPTGAPVLANAMFAAIDRSGNMALLGLDIVYNRDLFDLTRQISLHHEPHQVMALSWVSGGLSEIVEEFRGEQTERAKSYMNWFHTQIGRESIPQQRAALATKFIELSILLHPHNSELDFPIDVLQLDRPRGVHWVQRKPNCPAD